MQQEELLLEEAHRILKKSGIIRLDGLNVFCVGHMKEYLVKKFLRKAEHLHFSNPWRVKQLLHNKQFTCIEIYWLVLLPKSLRKFQQIVLTAKAQKYLQKLYWITMWFSHTFYVQATKDNHAS
ncbi:MAG TPA: hypothetical protein VFP93_03840, partial [Gammaproteobacteria bacterium]|nr:hypothetical protein [Gammaproteobacteria bacterium]